MSIFSKIKQIKREHFAWYMYDFGNSAYAAVILLAIYAIYFKNEVAGGSLIGTAYWGTSLTIAMIVVAIIAPILGAIADFSATKKRFLLIFSVITWVFTGLLFFVQKGDLMMGMIFFIFAEIGYRSSQVFYNSLLPEIAEPSEIGRVSGNGWAIGSLGGILCLVILLVPIKLIGGTLVVRLSFVFTAIFFALSSIPAFLWIKEKAVAKILPDGENYFSIAIKRIVDTAKSITNFKDFLRFVIAFFIYNDGILMALDFAAIIGAVLFGMQEEQLIVFMIAVQVTSILGAYFSAYAGSKIGFKKSLIYSILMMIGVVLSMLLAKNLTHFYIIGALAGFALTGVQAVSRTLVGYFAPKGKSAEFYGFFAVTGRTSSFIGPGVYTLVSVQVALYFQRQGMLDSLAEIVGHKYAIVSIAVFLLVGLLILLKVKDPSKEYIKS